MSIYMYCAPLLADCLLFSYEVEFNHGLVKNRDKKLAKSF